VAVVAVVVGALLLVELLAVPLGARALRSAAARCLASETLEVTDLRRPALPGLLIGRVRDVALRATGVEVGELRVAEARLRLAEVDLPWRRGDTSVQPAELELRVLEADLQRGVRDLLPVPLPLELDLRPGVAALGAPGLPVSLELTVDVEPDGTVVLRPVGGLELLERLGLEPRFPPTDGARPTAVEIGDGELVAELEVAFAGDGCERPLAVRSAPPDAAEVAA
jgi:hypothetical protein